MRTALTRWGSRVSAATLVAFVAVMVAGAPALAHHPEITAEADCDGRVTFTATAWSGFPDDPGTAADERTLSRTNPEITILVSMTGGETFLEMPGTPQYTFGPENDFTFTDTFKLPEPLPETVIVRAVATQTWGNAEELGGPRETAPIPVPRCDGTGQGSPRDGDAAGGPDGNQNADGQDADGGSRYGRGADGDDAATQDTQPEPPAGGQPAEPEQQNDSTLAAARAPASEVGPAGFALGAAGLVALVAGLVAAGLWARRRLIESQ